MRMIEALLRYRVWHVLGVLALVFAAGGCTKGPEALVASATKREAAGDLSGAVIDLKAAIQAQPNDGKIRYQLGRLYNVFFDGVLAEKELRKAQELGAVEGGRVAVELARSLKIQRKDRELLEQIKPSDVFEDEPHAALLSLRGHSQLMTGQRAEARASLESAAKLAAASADVQVLSTEIMLLDGKVEEAIKALEALVASVPARLDTKLILASFYRETGKSDQALELYNQVLRLLPNHYRALVDRSTMLALRGKFDDAKKDVAVLLKVYRAYPQPFIQRAFVLLVEGKSKDALEAALVALKAEPEPPQALLIAGLAYHALGQHLQAESVLTRLVSTMPRHLEGRRALASVQLTMKQGKKALDTLAPLLNLKVGDARTLALAAQAYALLGNFERAQDVYQKAADLAPEDSQIQIGRSLVSLDAGDLQGGSDQLSRAVQLTKEATTADEILILTHLRRDKPDEAGKALQNLEARAPDSPITQNLRGLVALAKYDAASATKSFEAALKKDPAFVAAAQNLAQLDLQEGKNAQAMARFKSVLERDPNNFKALLWTSELLLKEGKEQEAMDMLDKAGRSDPSAESVAHRLIRYQFRRGDGGRAVEVAERLVKAVPDSPEALALLGEVQTKAGSASQAIQSLTRLVALTKGRAESQVLLARAQNAAGDKAGAEKTLRTALAAKKDSLELQIGLASLLIEQGRPADAFQFAREILNTQPRLAGGYLVEGLLFEKQGKAKDAVAVYEKGTRATGSSDLAVRAFKIELALGDIDAANAKLKSWATANPRDLNIQRLLAGILAEKKDWQGAADVYAKILTVNPRDPDAANGLAWSYFKLGDRRALEAAEKAYELQPGYGYSADTLAWVLLSTGGDQKRAIRLLRKAMDLLPDLPSVKYHMAYAFGKSGDKDAARRLLKEVLKKQFEERSDAEKLLASLG